MSDNLMLLLERYREAVVRVLGEQLKRIILYDFEMQYEMEINPSVQSIQVYEQWKKIYPFFMNIEKEGVVV